MITFEEALNLVLDSAIETNVENVDMINSLNRVLAEDIFSDIDMPPFDKSAVDGYACKKADINNELELIEVIPAGKKPDKDIQSGQCSKIMTGAMLPIGADCVVMVEDTVSSDKRVKFVKETTSINICYKAEDIKKGALVLNKGIIIKPQDIAVMASVGAVNPKVSCQPKIGIISTGDELVEPSVIPEISQIRNSNAWQLIAQVQKAGAYANYEGIAKDDKESTYNKIASAFSDNDIVLLTGGVSMGDFDYVPEILNEMGVNILFKSIAVQPGRPTVFGLKDNKYIFGLPGNPVSSFVQFEMLAKPLILKMMGCIEEIPVLNLPMGIDYRRKKTERKAFIPVNIKDGLIFPVQYHGSAHIHAYAFANGLIWMEKGQSELRKGEAVNVRQL